MNAKEKYQAQKKISEALETLGVDGLIYELVQIAVIKRNEAYEGPNPAEKKYAQRLVEILSDCQEKVEGI